MNESQIIAEIKRLPLARNTAIDKLCPRLQTVAGELATRGALVRVGGYSRSTGHSLSYLYITLAGHEETRVFETTVKSSGFFTPISGKRFLDALESLENSLKQSPTN